jgi:endoglucanase
VLVFLVGCVGFDASSPDGPVADSLVPRPVGPAGLPPQGGQDTDPPAGDTGNSGEDTASPPDTATDTGTGAPEGSNPLAGLTFWVDPNSSPAQQAAAWRSSQPDDAAAMDKIAGQAVAKWLGDWNADIAGDVRSAVDAAAAVGAASLFIVYNLPGRDCGSYSGGGASDATAYEAWIDGIAAGLAGRKAVFVLEPDGLPQMDCLSSGDQDTRYTLLTYATATLRAAGGIVYVDAGNPAWIAADVMAERLTRADVASADGFAVNTSNFHYTTDVVSYGTAVSALVGGAHFIGDTSRNGLGPTSDNQWCNPDGRALGDPPTTETGNEIVDGLLWLKAPGESDGSCNGGPAAGTWWPEYALGLAQRATW